MLKDLKNLDGLDAISLVALALFLATLYVWFAILSGA